MVRALLIEFDVNTGKRAGEVNPKDPKLQCYGWQDLESVPAKEVRVVEDDRDLSQYEGIPGVSILEGEDQINQAIDAIVPERFSIQESTLFQEDLRQRGISLASDYSGQDTVEILKDLHTKGVVGIMKRSTLKIEGGKLVPGK